VKTVRPRDTGDAKLNLACYRNCELESTWFARSAVSDLVAPMRTPHVWIAAMSGFTPRMFMTRSGYRQRLSAARMFGVIEHDRGGSSAVRLTPIGQMIVDASRQREARVKAFLSVPLYRKLHDHYLGKILPPATALTGEIILLGVAKKQADRARQVFERSAEYAEFFAMGRDRLVMPGGVSETAPSIEERSKEKETNGNVGGQIPPTPPPPPRHPFIEGLLQTLPDSEEDWPAAGRVKWLQTAANIFDLIYKGDGGIKIELAMAQRSPRPSE
jgi:hypothetical protein